MNKDLEYFKKNLPYDVVADDTLLASYMRLLNDLELRGTEVDKSNIRMIVRLAKHRVTENRLYDEIKDSDYMMVAPGDKGLDIAKANQAYMGYAKFAELTNKMEQTLGLSPNPKISNTTSKINPKEVARKAKYDAI